MNKDKDRDVQQAVPGYDPQLVAMHTLPLAAIVFSTAVGRA